MRINVDLKKKNYNIILIDGKLWGKNISILRNGIASLIQFIKNYTTICLVSIRCNHNSLNNISMIGKRIIIKNSLVADYHHYSYNVLYYYN